MRYFRLPLADHCVADEAGDTLVEVLLALVVFGLTVVAILTAFATTITATTEHRALATGDAVLKSFVETATNQIQFQSSPEFVSCASVTSYVAPVVTPFNMSTLATENHVVITITNVQQEGPGCPGTPVRPPPQLITAQATSRQGVDVLSFVVADPDAALAGNVTSVSPNFGPVAGGTPVTITVSNGGFAASPAPTVQFGSTAATSVTVTSAAGVSPATLTAKSPPGTDTVDVTVTDSLGTTSSSASDRFTYAPDVTSISPTQGDTTTQVSIAGTGFAGVKSVTFGGVNATTYTFNNPDSITATPPPGSGTVDVQVTTAVGGTSLPNSNDKFSYGLSVISLSPAAGPDTGGTPVTITGTGFTVGQPATVTFGGVAATAVTVVDSQHVTATSPAGTKPVVDVQVTQSSVTSPIVQPGDQFTYNPGPVVGLGVSLVPGGSSGTPVLSCGAPSANDSCTISGVDKNGNANYFVQFVDAQGIASVFSILLDSTINVSGKGATPTSVVIPMNTTTSTQSVNSNHNNKDSATTITFGTFTLTVTVTS